MATAAADEGEVDVLRCTVCVDSYTDPCTLQCNHSFCRRCITDYVKTQPDAVQAKTIPCPSCRQVTRVPDPSRPVDEWAGQLQPGHVVQELMVKVNKETAGQLDISHEGEKGREEGNISSLKFCIDKQNITQVLDSLHIGEIVTTCLPIDLQSSPVLSESVDVRIQEDETDPELFNITVLEVEGGNTVVVTDLDNYCVKSFYTRNNKTYHSRLQFDNEPCGLTQLGETNVMVAVPELCQIVTVAVIPDLVQVNVINTSKEYFSLAVMSPSRLAAGAWACVDILNMQGRVMKTVTTHNNTKLFVCPCFMCVSNTEHLLVTDYVEETVTCLTSEGQVVWIYSSKDEGKFTFPRGITTTGEGDILMADRDLKNVLQLSETGEYIRDILISQHGLKCPSGVCLDKQGALYICDKDEILKFVFVRK